MISVSHKFGFLLFFLSINISLGYGQESDEVNHVIDSLKNVVNSPAHDTTRINALIDWDNLIYLNNKDLDYELNSDIIRIGAKSIKSSVSKEETEFYNVALGFAYGNLGILEDEAGNHFVALENYQKSLNYRKLAGDKSKVASTLMNMASAYSDIGDYPRAKEGYFESIEMVSLVLLNETDSNRINDQIDLKADAYVGLGSIELLQENFEKHREYNEMAQELYFQCGSMSGVARTYTN